MNDLRLVGFGVRDYGRIRRNRHRSDPLRGVTRRQRALTEIVPSRGMDEGLERPKCIPLKGCFEGIDRKLQREHQELEVPVLMANRHEPLH